MRIKTIERIRYTSPAGALLLKAIVQADQVMLPPPTLPILNLQFQLLTILIAARRRKVTLSQLPPDITLKQVASILFNGAIDTFSIVRSTVDSSVAEAIFATGDGCKAYYDATPNGLNMKLKEKIYSIMVDIDLHVAPVSSQLQEWLDKGVTRCVRAVGVDEQWTIPALWRVAEGTKRALRKVEHVVDSKNPAGVCPSLIIHHVSAQVLT
jgi:hypothetical protein